MSLESLDDVRDPKVLEGQAKGATKMGLPPSASRWFPVLDEFRNFLASGEGAVVAEQIKDFNISLE